ncbi:hypothetical protein PBY51_019650 [Eleginops maclovinus]
MNCM